MFFFGNFAEKEESSWEKMSFKKFFHLSNIFLMSLNAKQNKSGPKAGEIQLEKIIKIFSEMNSIDWETCTLIVGYEFSKILSKMKLFSWDLFFFFWWNGMKNELGRLINKDFNIYLPCSIMSKKFIFGSPPPPPIHIPLSPWILNKSFFLQNEVRLLVFFFFGECWSFQKN